MSLQICENTILHTEIEKSATMETKMLWRYKNEPKGLSKKADLKLLIVARSKLREVIHEQNRAIIYTDVGLI